MAPRQPVAASYYDGLYNARQLAEHEIRVICVEPCTSNNAPVESQEIYCHLMHLSLEDKTAPKYTALSYTWGSEEHSKSVILDGHRIYVRENLADALRVLRPKIGGEQLFIWIDALSIDQTSEKDKNHQIKLMRRIFQQAETVHIWIGRDFSGSRDAFQFVRSVNRCAKDDLVDFIRGPGRESQLEHLRKFFYKEYWWRIWVVQEVVVAQHAIVICGDDSIPWEDLYAVGDKLMEVKDEIRKIYHDKPDSVYKLLQGAGPRALKLPVQPDQKELPLLDLLRSHYSKFSTDSRDKVFGIVGISDARPAFTIDYTWSTEKVFIYTAKFIIEKTRNLDIICNPKRDESTLFLPSWVPDWTRHDTHSRHREMGLYIRQGDERWLAGGHNTREATFSSDGSALYVEGIVLDKLETLGLPLNLNDIGKHSLLTQEKAKLIATCEKFLEYWTLYTKIHGQDLEKQDLFERTLFGGSWPTTGEFEPEHRLQLMFSLCRRLLPDAVFTAPKRPLKFEVDNEKNCENMGSAASLRMHGYRMVFGSTKNFAGLAPWSAQPGDLVCVLLGCSFPVVLRPVKDYYVLVGEVYVDQYMRGEAMKDSNKRLCAFEIR